MDINKCERQAKKLIDMPYNQLNLDNYIEMVCSAFPDLPNSDIQRLSEKGPISLMSGQHDSAGLLRVPWNFPDKGRRIILIGKGLLFDAGGYDLKPEMSTMKSDMAGMATCIAASCYLSRNNVVAVCPVATNFLHNNQIVPGDIISIGSKEVEILDADAEGRLVIAEALSNLDIKKDDIVVTVATLTGCCEYAIGDRATAILTPNDKLARQYYEASLKTKELSWRLPLWDYLQPQFSKKKIPNVSR